MSNIVTAFYKYLGSKTNLTALIGSNISKNKIEKKELLTSGQSALVLKAGPGDTPRPNSLANPRLNLFIYSDHTRVNGNVTAEDREDRMWNIYYVINPYMHWIDHERRVLDGIKILGCIRGAEPQLIDDKELGVPYLWVPYDINYVM